jgi:hypothetical protein
MSIPTCEQFSAAAERIARTLAIGLAWIILAAEATYKAGLWTGRTVHKINDWLARASHAPMAEATKVATAAVAWADRMVAPPSLLTVLEAEILTDEQLQQEIASYESGSIADAFAAAAAEMAASDARLYRSAGERIAEIRETLAEAEKPARRKPARARKVKTVA